MSRDKNYVCKRLSDAWNRAYEAQKANSSDDYLYAKWGEILAGLEQANSALALVN
jgi:hypothetical protein